MQVGPAGTQQLRHGGSAQAGFVVICGLDFISSGLQSGHGARNSQPQFVAAAHGEGKIADDRFRFLDQRGDFLGKGQPGGVLQCHAGCTRIHGGLNRFFHIRELCAGGVAADKFHVIAQGLGGLHQLGNPLDGLGRLQMGDVFQLRAGQRHGDNHAGLFRAFDCFPGELHIVHGDAGVQGQYAAFDRGA